MSLNTDTEVFTRQEAEAIIELVVFAYRFCSINRATFLPDGKTPENDGVHTVVSSLVGVAIAEKYFPHLDSGLVSKLFLAHDLVEAYAGDTPTLQIDDNGRKSKQLREAAALKRIDAEFGQSFPELVQLVHLYEALDSPEAKYVKMLDKLMPMLSHILNQGTTLKRAGIDLETYRTGHEQRTREYLETTYGQANPELLSLREVLKPFLEEAVFNLPPQE